MTASIDSLPREASDAGGEQRGLAGHRDAHRLDRDEDEQDGQPDVGDVDDRGERWGTPGF